MSARYAINRYMKIIAKSTVECCGLGGDGHSSGRPLGWARRDKVSGMLGDMARISVAENKFYKIIL